MKQWLLPLILLSILVVDVKAGNTGKITGVVKDEKTGEEIVGASVVIEGTTRGAATNVDGYYVILNMPPGKYTLVCSAVGYNKKTIAGVSVSIDLTTTINFQLGSAVVEQEEVVVTAEKPVIQKDLTASTAIVGNEQIVALPVTEVSQVLNLQAGFVAGSLRGGRSGEIKYWVDGVPLTDVYDGSQVVEVNKNLVSELQLVSGAYNAEYGEAMSGIVNIATKEGSSKFTGSLQTYFGDHASSHNDVFHGISDFKPTAIRDYEGNVSGPVIGDDLTFFVNGRYVYNDGYLYGYRRFTPSNISETDSNNIFHLYRDPSGQGDSSRVSLNWSERKYGQGKLTWHVSGTMKASFNYIYDNATYKAYDHMYTFNPDGIGNTYNISNTGIFQLSQTVSSRVFYTVGASYFDKSAKYYLYEDIHDPRYTNPQLFTTVDSYSFYSGGTDLSRFSRGTKTLLGKVDLSAQIDESNLFKAGVQATRHKLTYESYALLPILSEQSFNKYTSNPYISTMIPEVTSPNYESYTHQPTQLAAYIQDKMEFKDFILNIGVRFDYFQPDGVVLSDPTDPNIYAPLKDQNKANTLAQRLTYWYQKASSKSQLSPRIGGSFPITDRGVVHFSYGHFFQIPDFQLLYARPDFKIQNNGGIQGQIGNADLKPEQTIKGEIGIQQQISSDISVDITAYIQDIRNLTTTGPNLITMFGGSTQYGKYQNQDFGFVKGITVDLEKRFGGGLTAAMHYTYQIARGSGSNPNDAANLIAGGSIPEIQLFPLNWDQRNTLNLTGTYNSKGLTVSMIAQYGSGTPYTPRTATDISAILTNSQQKPAYFDVDATASYEIPLNPLRLVVWVRAFNLFDTENEIGVWDDTGRAGFTTRQAVALATHTAQQVNSVADYYLTPTNFSEPRRVEFGMNLEF